MSRGRKKRNIRYQQFQGGYAQVEDTELRAVLEGYRLGELRRNEIRVYAARLEFSARHPNCERLTIARILNCDSKRKGNRRLSNSQIEQAARNLDHVLPKLQGEFDSQLHAAGKASRTKPVARKVLQHIARGGATTVEALFCFAYFMRRIAQSKPMQRLEPEERYARFRYCDFQEWTGVHRATQCRILPRLLERGFLTTAPVHKLNENLYGQLFVDGATISLIRTRTVRRRQATTTHRQQKSLIDPQKRSTPVREIVNAPPHETSTPKNTNQKREIEERERFVLKLQNSSFARHKDTDLQRIIARAAQMVDQTVPQAA